VENNFTSNMPPTQLAFQFDSPVGFVQHTPHAHPASQNNHAPNGFAAYANGGGMGSMVERMHNVTDRDLLPQKRRKVQDTRPDNQGKAEFHGGGKGGVLGEYMRQKEEEGRKGRVSNGIAVDISSGRLRHDRLVEI